MISNCTSKKGSSHYIPIALISDLSDPGRASFSPSSRRIAALSAPGQHRETAPWMTAWPKWKELSRNSSGSIKMDVSQQKIDIYICIYILCHIGSYSMSWTISLHGNNPTPPQKTHLLRRVLSQGHCDRDTALPPNRAAPQIACGWLRLAGHKVFIPLIFTWKMGEKWGYPAWFSIIQTTSGEKNKNTSTKLAWAFKLRLWPTHYPGAPETKLPGWSAVEMKLIETPGDIWRCEA